MNNFIKINIIILLLSGPVIAEIALPEISPGMRSLADKAIQSNARLEAFDIQKPIVNQALKKKVDNLTKEIKQRTVNHQATVKSLVDETINNNAWRFKQTQLVKSLNKDLGVNDKQIETVSGHRLYLFVSSSMPKNKTRTYARQLQKYPNTQMVMRGFIGGGKKMQPTMAYIKSILVKNKDCSTGIVCKTVKTRINIDPVLFQRYDITKVPTLVYVDALSGGNYCSEGNTDIVDANGVHKFIGLAPLEYMISELADKTKLSKLKTLSEL